jgi:nucleotide-binding universal stress UspA family protein
MYTIVVALDGTQRSEQAVSYGVILARALNGTLDLIHVLEEPIFFDLMPSLIMPDRGKAEHYLRGVAAGLPEDVPVNTYVVRGNPVDELLRLTANAPNTLLVLATRGHGTTKRVVLGSVADKVVRGATVPVLLVRAADAQPATFRSIVVPLDGSPLAEQALPIAAELARASGAAVRLVRVADVYVVAPYAGLALSAKDIMSRFASELRQDARDYLDRVASTVRADGLHVVWEVRDGQPAQEIVRMAEGTGSDLIVIASHGRGGIRRWAFGSVADEVLHLTTTPVLLIPAKAMAADLSEQREAAGATR